MAVSGRVAILGGARTPFVKAGGVFRDRSALDLATHAVDGLLQRVALDPNRIDELACGIVVVDPRRPQMGREVVLNSALPAVLRGYTLTDNCITGVTAVAALWDAMLQGRAEASLAVGVESMSNPAVLFSPRASRKFLRLARARGFRQTLGLVAALRPGDFKPTPPGVAEPSTGLSMGEHCELMVKEWAVGREEQDRIAYRSHRLAMQATEDGRLSAEIRALDGVGRDLLIRADTTLEQLSGLRPAFDRRGSGTITPGNSSPLTDGAAALLLGTEAFAEREGLEPLAFLRAVEFAAIDPADGLLMAPAIAVPRMLGRLGLDLQEIGIVEMHEAFAGQVACNLLAWERGWKESAIGAVDPERLNPLGGSIAVGHPFAATGLRMATTLANEMRRRRVRYGMVSICGAGATAAALLLERP